MRLTQSVLAMLLCCIQYSSMATIVIRTAAQESSEPKYIAINQAGKPAIGGICVDIFRAMENLAPNLRFQGDQVWMPRMRIDAHFRDNRIDVICGVQNITRNTEHYQLLATPLFTVNYLLAVRVDDPIKVQSWDDIRQLDNEGIIMAIHGFGIVDILHKLGGLQIDAGATSSLSNLRKLLAGRGRFYCHRSPGIKAAIKSAHLENKIRLLDQPTLSEKFYMGVRKNLAPEQIKLISDALQVLDKNGELKRIFEQYRE
ncbi:substrate-binding periplasmic protein [Undibacterium flavidum]|uniref:Transporter substrate-binding domain-containing protein n=1 Tax=Undibacterium flavidum TaxID=2762297 RepID=A0ABR6Y7U7_9BURK|nr:transporter substrate-binding domain-containing protein [Undibacterium flavidum]MBC3872690.1 transporter substrate-binding domain-containing protein [Undibacterium flavidum]